MKKQETATMQVNLYNDEEKKEIDLKDLDITPPVSPTEEENIGWYQVTYKKDKDEKEYHNKVYAKSEGHAKRIVFKEFGKTYTFEEMFKRIKNKQSCETQIEIVSVEFIKDNPKKNKKKE